MLKTGPSFVCISIFFYISQTWNLTRDQEKICYLHQESETQIHLRATLAGKNVSRALRLMKNCSAGHIF
jgi:hypothetical protein